MRYYLHDTDSFNDEKITELYLNFGYEGLGLFYTVLEKIAKQEKPIKTSILKSQLKVGKRLEKCWLFMESLGMLSSNNGETFNERVLNDTEKYQEKKEKNAEKIAQWRAKQADIKNVTGYNMVSEPVRNPSNISKVNKIKVNISKEEKKQFVPPALHEVIEYFVSNGYPESLAKKAFDYYSVAAWKDSKGNQVKNWKQKFISQWFKEENKVQKTGLLSTLKPNRDHFYTDDEFQFELSKWQKTQL